MEYIKVILPSLCVGLVFWYVLRSVIKADSIERKEMEKYYDQMDAGAGAQDVPAEASGQPDVADKAKDGAHGTRNEAGPDR
ncbi:hypothetical protein NQ038_01355 [Brevibacterium sp. 50QC2O2]|jgi:hypothetical protein|uniref:hypothetical protein n=1 Tax=unclassified Brevibacterium TaxID=2614124 RepID=UPI00211BF065|nr:MULTISPECIES: hypothetical protein [unclassified Brevibacterium]MCQ9368179.1 hypothetical protein [Brevibacterium sp. 91QC2O2]MCQ9387302.1 hypothetical protein [Brevibacterium sp. 50QC2O2]